MFKIKIADLIIEIDNKYNFVEKMCADYVTDEERIDLHISCTDEEIEREKSLCGEGYSMGYLESLCVYRHICEGALEYDVLLMHSAVIEYEGKAYAFLAKSGTGKSTHIHLWRKTLGEGVKVINGDKPLYRFVDGVLYAYGTPWCGKEGWNTNTRAPLKAICYIERALENSIEKISGADSSLRIMRQVLMPKEAPLAIKTLELIDRLLEKIPSYVLKCNISEEASRLAYDAMRD